LVAAPAIVRAQGANGIALVIGNSKYKWEAPLPNVKRDVAEVAARFRAMGLKTELAQDLGRDAMRQILEKFAAMSHGSGIAVLYFAGHGVTIAQSATDMQSNFVPVDADLSSPASLSNLVPLTAILDSLRGSGHRLVLVDACRNNPSEGWQQLHLARSFVGGVSEHAMEYHLNRDSVVQRNSLVLYATAPGFTAFDGPAGQHSPFAAAFLKQLETPIDLSTLTGRLRRGLLLATRGQQMLFSYAGSLEPFALGGSQSAAAENLPYDRSNVVELPNAYETAKQIGFPLPAGLVAYRSAGNPRDAQKVGAFKFSWRGGEPGVLIVLSNENPQNIDIVYTTRTIQAQIKQWRYIRGTPTQHSIEFENGIGVQRNFRWKDANSGTYAMSPTAPTTPFTRLDG
jgi:hypothetical protein